MSEPLSHRGYSEPDPEFSSDEPNPEQGEPGQGAIPGQGAEDVEHPAPGAPEQADDDDPIEPVSHRGSD